jgi:hypothetical protein
MSHFQPAVRFFQLCMTELWLGLEPRSLLGIPEAIKLTKALAVLKLLGSLIQSSSRVVTNLVIDLLAPR